MKKTFISILTAVMMIPFISGFKMMKKESESLCLFPELTFSNAVLFDETENNDEKITICEKSEKVQVKFKLIEWIKSVFTDN